jgi:hypothetical protein
MILLAVFTLMWRLPSPILELVYFNPTKTLIAIYLLPIITILITTTYSWLRLAVILVMTIAVAAFILAATPLSDFNAKIGIHIIFALLTSINYLILQRLYLTNDRTENAMPISALIDGDRKNVRESRAFANFARHKALR